MTEVDGGQAGKSRKFNYCQLPNLILEVPEFFVSLFSVAVLIAYLMEYVAM